MWRAIVLLVFLPLCTTEVCNPKVLGSLDSSLAYQEGIIEKVNKFVEEGEHTVLYSDGYQTSTAFDLTKTVKACLVTRWFRDTSSTDYYRHIKIYDEQAKFRETVEIKIKINKPENHMFEIWPNGDIFDLYPVHLDDGILGLYACQVHQNLNVDGVPSHRKSLKNYFGLSMQTKETKMKAILRSAWVSKGVSNMESMGLRFTAGNKLSWCYSEENPTT